MPRFCPRRTIAPGPGMLLAFAALTLVAPRPAEAASSCAWHRVNLHDPKQAMLADLEILEPAAAAAPLPRPEPPCSGPHCRQVPPGQPLPAAPPNVTRGDAWAIVPRLPDRVDDPTVAWRVADHGPRPCRHVGRLERPPRPIAG